MDDLISIPKNRVENISTWVRLGCVTIITLLSSAEILFFIFLWTGTGDSIIAGDSGIGFYIPPAGAPGETIVPFADFSLNVKILITLTAVFYYGWYIKMFYHLYRLYYHYAKGKIFTTEANGQIKQIGITGCLLAVSIPLILPVSHIIVSLILKGRIDLSGIPGNDLIRVTLTPIYILVFSVTIICISWVMEKGREMQENQELTI